MGNFSRDPQGVAENARRKRYVAVRMQQGVPLLDADWNLLDDLRRMELQDLSHWTIGDGVPAGSAGFRIVELAAGNVGSIVLRSKAVGPSHISVDLVNSSAAAVLGFGSTNAQAYRNGSSPAQITSLAKEPFALTDGSKLVIQAENLSSETVTFNNGDFANIAQATTVEVITKISASVNNSTASVGAGNDFLIRGGAPGELGRILVEGQMVLTEADVPYSGQALYQNNDLATVWGVSALPALTTLTADDLFVAYLDVWNRGVASDEDAGMVDARIGIETAVRLRCEWVVRVARATDYLAVLAARPVGHNYYVLAEIARRAGVPAIDATMIRDKRVTDVGIYRAIAYRSDNEIVQVDTTRFKNMLMVLSTNIRDLINYLTTTFLQPNIAYLAGEVNGINALNAVASISEHGVSLINARMLDTYGALGFMDQLLNAQKRLVDVWQSAVLPIVRTGGKVYEAIFKGMIDNIKMLLVGPLNVEFNTFLALTDALAAQKLDQVVRTQERINSEYGQQTSKPTGYLVLKYLGSPTPMVIRNQPVDLRYEVSGSVTPEDDIDVTVFMDAAWTATPMNASGAPLPFALKLGPQTASGPARQEFLVRVLVPNINSATTPISLKVNARHNAGGLYYDSPSKVLTINQPPPFSEDAFIFLVQTTNVQILNGVYQVPTNSQASVNFRFFNNTPTPLPFDLQFDPQPGQTAGWTITKGSFGLTGLTAPPNTNYVPDLGFRFVPPPNPGIMLTFTLRAKRAGTQEIVSEIQIILTSIA